METVKRQAWKQVEHQRDRDIDQAFDGAEVVYAKKQGSKSFYGAPEKDIATRTVSW